MLKKDARFLRMLGDETRLKIIQTLLGGEMCSCKFINITERAQSTVSSHLRDLEKEGILRSRREGRNILYSIKDKRVYELCKLLNIRGSKVNEDRC
ncbi:MAG: helix-turn-helix transcriptional regulator [DPANN group archaeon]|nr:helix-turn-helix transcriptional regulator [DPANN group archaeon]